MQKKTENIHHTRVPSSSPNRRVVLLYVTHIEVIWDVLFDIGQVACGPEVGLLSGGAVGPDTLLGSIVHDARTGAHLGRKPVRKYGGGESVTTEWT